MMDFKCHFKEMEYCWVYSDDIGGAPRVIIGADLKRKYDLYLRLSVGESFVVKPFFHQIKTFMDRTIYAKIGDE